MREFASRSLCVLCTTALMVMATGRALRAATQLDTNLLINGDAEGQLDGASDNATVVEPLDWDSTGNLSVVKYDIGFGFPNFTDPGPTSRGKRFFAGGPDNSSSRCFQTLDISDLASDIDA